MTIEKLNAGFRRVLALGGSAIMVLSACSSTTERNTEFQRAAAGIDARMQSLHFLEEQMSRNAGNPAMLDQQRRKWDETRRRVDDLIGAARAAVVTSEERGRVDQLAAWASRSDARLQQMHAQAR